MTTAGVRLDDGRLVWVETAGQAVQPLDAAVVRIADAEQEGTVVVAPAQVHGNPLVSGTLLSAQTRRPIDPDCSDLPGADMPPLGTEVAGGMVTAINAVTRTMTIMQPNGERVEQPFAPASRDEPGAGNETYQL